MKQALKFILLILPLFINCGSTVSALNGGITLDAPVADVEGAGDDRGRICGTYADAPEGSFLRIVNTKGDDTNTVTVSLGSDGYFNVMVAGGYQAKYYMTVIDSSGNAISETSGPYVRGELNDDVARICDGLQSNLFNGTATLSPDPSSSLPAPELTLEPKNFESAQICGTFEDAPEGSMIRIEALFTEDFTVARNTFDVTIDEDGSFSALILGDSVTVFTAIVYDADGNMISSPVNFVLGESLFPEDMTCPPTSNVLVDENDD